MQTASTTDDAAPMTPSSESKGPRPLTLHLDGNEVPVMHWQGKSNSGGMAGLHLIVCPPFADEMNKSRHVLSALAQQLSAEGADCWLPDLLGTGDSLRPFADASLAIWLRELEGLLGALRARGAQRVVLLGVRLGSLLALELARRHPDEPLSLLFWQPVLSGRKFMRQFLRLATAGALGAGGASNPAAPADRLANGEIVEVGGYPLTPDLHDAIAQWSAPELSTLHAAQLLAAFEVRAGAEDGADGAAAPSAALAAWLEASGAATASRGSSVVGDPFWSTQELGHAPALLDATLDALRSLPASSSAALQSPHAAQDLTPGATLQDSATTFVFSAVDEMLVGHLRTPDSAGDTGVLFVVGGPQYRAGSHRMFIDMAADLAAHGVAAMTFDFRGMGDASGVHPGFTDVRDDIRAAIDSFFERVPGLRRVVLWGLCDGATAAADAASQDPRVAGLVMANPWIYSEETKAAALVQSHYRSRLTSAAFWSRVLRGEVNVLRSAGEFIGALAASMRAGAAAGSEAVGLAPGLDEADLAGSLGQCLEQFSGPVMLLLSEHDVTAAEFAVVMRSDDRFAQVLERPLCSVVELSGADHTFSHATALHAVQEKNLELLMRSQTARRGKR